MPWCWSNAWIIGTPPPLPKKKKKQFPWQQEIRESACKIPPPAHFQGCSEADGSDHSGITVLHYGL